MANIIGTTSNDTLFANSNDILTGGGGNNTYNFSYDSKYSITDFGGVGKGVNPSAAVIAEVDTLNFDGYGFTARNLVLTQNGSNLEITFDAEDSPKIILQNFALENLDNLSLSTGATVNLHNILFDGQTTITDSFDVFNANSTQSTIFNLNTVTFLNDLNNNVNGFDNSDDVINGQGGDDLIDGKSGNDLLRGGAGNNTLIGGVGNDVLNVEYSTGNNILNGGSGDDYLDAGATSGNNLLFGGDGNDTLSTSYVSQNSYNSTASSGNNTLNGGAGDDYLDAESPQGNNLLSGGDGNDTLSTSGVFTYRAAPNFVSSGNNTLNGGAGNDYLMAEGSSGNNLLSGGDGNDYLDISSIPTYYDGILLSSGNNTLNGGAGDDTLRAEDSTGNNFLFGDDGNDSFYLNLENQTVDGGKGDDLLSVDYSYYSAATGGITTTFNPITNTGSITVGTYRVNYKDIERLNISGTGYNDNIVGNSGNDTLSTGNGGSDTIDGGEGDDVLSVNYNGSAAIVTTYNATTNTGSIRSGTNQVNYKNIERLNILGTDYNDLIVGNSGNDTLSTGNSGNDTIDGGEGGDVLLVNYNGSAAIATTYNATTNTGSIRSGTNQVNYKNIERLNILGTDYNDLIVGNSGNDTLSGGVGNDTLTGGAGNDEFVYNNDIYYNKNTDTITDFGGVGKGSNPSATVIASVDTLQFTSDGFTAQNLQLTQNGNNLEITFENLANSKVILQNFKLENLDNLPATSSRPAIGNILFSGQTSVTDSFDVFDANSTQTNLFNKNTVTFLNDLDNNITGFDNSNDVINGQGGNDIIDGLSGDDIIRGGAGNDTLIGGAGNDTLIGGAGNNILDGDADDDILNISGSIGNNTLLGGADDDRLSANASTGDNLLSGGDGNDSLDISGSYINRPSYSSDSRTTGNNTLLGGAGNDTLSGSGSTGDNLLSGGDGNDSLNISGYYYSSFNYSEDSRSTGNNTLLGGAGNDTLSGSGSTGNNLLSGGDGNDYLDISGSDPTLSIVNNTLNGGAGDDTLDATNAKGNNLLSGGDGNDSFNLGITSSGDVPSDLATQTVNGGNGNDLLSMYYFNATTGITSTFNATTNTGSVTADTYLVNYNNVERLNIIGTDYNDLIVGSNGNDTLTGGKGNDSLIGGNGTDTFVFYNYNEGVDDLYDFNATNDLIQISAVYFAGGLSSGSLSANQFTIGTSATTTNQRFIYNSATGGLFFDLDGSASGFTQVKFAQLSAGLSLTENNFVVV
ncbi:calcium-binding protein [Nostoc sp. 'Peltigera membranacea cyanobiont' 213]|uniref:beta strand repeat-containing protein n=1 Tax=Nostoc sp. 'Peltigera membranacea cyanobiont' 213 TaxID=2014530 RepID=UPI000B959BE6|nr:calcium-binding protein [Nostoc sp. 'Peltigera membranacea cyanobiont' 213]OYD86969.1 calcium-binding protein [Nostoc sp. 'Peltigera membranacea cyanobiont' 213]